MACAAVWALSCASDPVTRAGDLGGAAAPPQATPEVAWRRVIAELRIEKDGTGAAPPDSPVRRRQIAEVRERLLKALPAGQYRSLRTYETLPFVALDVSPAGLAALRSSPLVAGISDDRLERPQGTGGDGPASSDPR